jgi:hypothetical protein
MEVVMKSLITGIIIASSILFVSCEENFKTLRIISCTPENHTTGVAPEFFAEIKFNSKVNRSDIEESFTITGISKVDGQFRWLSGDTFRFVPDNPVTATGRYVMELPRTVRDIDGNVMESDFISEFYIGEDFTPPEITSSDPPFTSGASVNIPVTQNITVNFSKSMNRESVETSFSVTPDVPGYFSWSEAVPGMQYSRLTYVLLSTMSYGKLYSFTVSGKALDASGNRMSRDYRVNFITGSDFIPPEVSGIYDAAVVPGYWIQGTVNDGTTRDVRIAVDFSEPMDRVSVESAFSITPSVPGNFAWDSDMKVVFTPSGLLAPEPGYQVYIDKSAMDINGLKLNHVYTVEIRTGAPDSLYVKCGNISGSADGVSYTLLSPGMPSPSAWPLIISMGGASNQSYYVKVQFISLAVPYTPVDMNKYSVINNTLIETYKSEPGSAVENAAITDITWENNSTVIYKISPLTNKLLGHSPALYRITIAGGTSGIRDMNQNYPFSGIVIDLREAL